MKAKAKIILDLDNQSIISVDFMDATLNSAPITKGLMDNILKKVANTSVRRFTFVPNMSEDPIGNPHLFLEATLEIHPKIYTVSDMASTFRYRCILQCTPYNNPITWEQYSERREKHLLDLSKKITESQNA